MARSDHRLFVSASAQRRREQALAWLAERGASEALLVVGATAEAASQLMRDAMGARQAVLGWHRTTLGGLAAELAALPLASAGRTTVAPLAREALAARVIHREHAAGRLGGYMRIADRPGLARALARTAAELSMAGLAAAEVRAADPDLGALYQALQRELEAEGLADRAAVFEHAALAASGGQHPLLGLPMLLLDVPVTASREARLLDRLLARSPMSLTTAAAGDGRSRRFFEALPAMAVTEDGTAEPSSLARLQRQLFTPASERAPLGDDVTVVSAPGESRECVEIAREIVMEAERGTAFERIGVLLRAPDEYRDHLLEALGRAGVPAYFARGTMRPDPAGRALLALIACADEQLSASRFAEYLSLGVVPEPDGEGAPPPAPPPAERFALPDEDALPLSAVRQAVPENPPAPSGGLRVPRRWEQLLVDAAVIGRLERWQSRLDGLAAALEVERAELDKDDEPRAAALDRRREELARLRDFSLPLVAELADLPARADWGTWIERLSALATRALRHPSHVLAVLGELLAMAPVGPVTLSDVRLVLAQRLGELLEPPRGSSRGKVWIGPIDRARGLTFDVVFVPGLSERMFPKKVAEDPLALDDLRRRLSAELATSADRIEQERLMLRLAVGAAARRVILSYPRIDTDRGRPRVPSFYGLEALRAAAGALPSFDELARLADRGAAVRMGWPAPREASRAIDELEYDLALLDRLMDMPEAERRGAARYLLTANEHLARSLRFRAMRWERPSWSWADGLKARAGALADHAFSARAYSATALEKYAACPYRFFLAAVQRLAPRDKVGFIEDLDALQRGRLIHETQRAVLSELRDRGLLPLDASGLAAAEQVLETELAAIGARYKSELAPAIERVWQDGIAEIHGDLREWLHRMLDDPSWVPHAFELGFGMRADRELDPASTPEPIELSIGVRLRGAIDLVERQGRRLRATDHKTGRASVPEHALVHGGTVLQPLLYALALEARYPDHEVVGGRLYYATRRGDFEERFVALDDEGRRAVERVVRHIGEALAHGFLPAAPAKDACRWCDYKSVCGPYEEQRARRKKPLTGLTALRESR